MGMNITDNPELQELHRTVLSIAGTDQVTASAAAWRKLLKSVEQRARIDELEGWLKGVAGRYPLLADAIPRRIKELKAQHTQEGGK